MNQRKKIEERVPSREKDSKKESSYNKRTKEREYLQERKTVRKREREYLQERERKIVSDYKKDRNKKGESTYKRER